MKNRFPKGSEWAKWDIHVHTPESILSHSFGSDWDNYVKILFKQAIENKIIAIGITDYYSIDGYKKIKNDYLSNERKLQELFTPDEVEKIKTIFIFPNLEFRINKLIVGNESDLTWNKKVNFHVIFSDEIDIIDIEENFLYKLHFEHLGVGEGTPQKLSLTKRNLIELGRTLKSQQAEFNQYSDFFVGMLNASVDDNEIVQCLSSQDSKFKSKYLLALPADEDLSAVSWRSQGHLSRKLLLQKSHIILSSNPNSILFGLGKKHSTTEEFVSEFGNLKPCLWGSDAHSFEKLFKPEGDRYTWIKANPTFEGLKQVIFEPEDRVRIQQNIPEEKTPYLVIDKVRFIDQTSSNTFQPTWIEFNQNLNAIIGGKSSGKSLLLFHIAKTIDPEQVEGKTNLVKSNDYNDFIAIKPFDFEVLWENGDSNILSDPEKQGSQITFLPQLYINHLAEENGEQQLTELIESILKQNDNYKTFIDSKDIEINECRTKIFKSIDERIVQINKFKKLSTDKNNIGNKDKIAAEIKRLKEEIDLLKKESGFTDEQNAQYQNLANKVQAFIKRKNEYTGSIESINNYKSQLNIYIDNIIDSVNRINIEFENHTMERFLIDRWNTQLLSDLVSVRLNRFNDIDTLLLKLNDKYLSFERKIESINTILKPFQEKIKNQEKLLKLEKERTQQNEKLVLIEKYDTEIKSVIEKGKQCRTDIFDNYSKLFQIYKNIYDELKKPEYNKIDNELVLDCELIFDVDNFSQFTNLFDNRTRLNTVFHRIFDDNNVFIYQQDNHIQTIETIFREFKLEENIRIKLKSKVGLDEIFYKLMGDYFIIKYSINYKGENILQMSPGKRGLILLQLILHISNATHPILIDQPEDNLDNRTIFDELKEFIMSKKSQRQIIMVTHNANLVVSTDAENIVVANQSGQQKGKDMKEFLFEYVTGSLEFSFTDDTEEGILFKCGIKEHVCDILEGGKEAFQQRERKYGFR